MSSKHGFQIVDELRQCLNKLNIDSINHCITVEAIRNTTLTPPILNWWTYLSIWIYFHGFLYHTTRQNCGKVSFIQKLYYSSKLYFVCLLVYNKFNRTNGLTDRPRRINILARLLQRAQATLNSGRC